LERRQVLRALGLSAVTVDLAACGATTDTSTGSSASATTAAVAAAGEIPDESAGPFPGDPTASRTRTTCAASRSPTPPDVCVTGDVTSGYTVSLTVGVDTVARSRR
jgi:hypothetical protein